jgi:hypothetical protein
MAEELEDLAEVATDRHVFIRVVPLEENKGAIIGSLGNFMLMSLSNDDTDDSVLYRERFLATRSTTIRIKSVPSGTRSRTSGSLARNGDGPLAGGPSLSYLTVRNG